MNAMTSSGGKRSVSAMKATIYALIIVLVVFSVSELALRIWDRYLRLSYLTYDPEHGRPALVPNARVQTRGEKVSINSRGFVGPEFDDTKPAGMIRIIALGDSCTFAGGWYETTYSGMLSAMLNARNPNRRFEVINAGISGYNSEFALARLKDELLSYKPDLVTIYIGWNDLMKTNPANGSATGKHTTLWKLLNQSYLVKAYSKLIFFYLRPLVIQPNLEEDIKGSHVFDGFIPATFQTNLEAMAKVLNEQHIQAIIVTLPTVVRSHMTREDLQRNHIFFPYFAGAYSLEKFLSLHRSYNAVIQNVATRNHIRLIDLDTIFNTHHKDEMFQDTMHLSDAGNRLVAVSLLEPIEQVIMGLKTAFVAGR
jgi:lysophospholipase L1-like esterase